MAAREDTRRAATVGSAQIGVSTHGLPLAQWTGRFTIMRPVLLAVVLAAPLLLGSPASAQGPGPAGPPPPPGPLARPWPPELRRLVPYDEGYERGYREGVRDARRGRAPRVDELREPDRPSPDQASRDHDSKDGPRRFENRRSFRGPRGEMQRGYLDGYRAGFTSERDGRTSRDEGPTRAPRGPTSDPAFARGQADGYRRGFDDGRDRDRYDATRDGAYRDGDAGYFREYGPKNAYRRNYRDGFREGYEDGYRDGARRAAR